MRPSATPYVGLPKGQTCVRTGLPLIIPGWESRIVRYNRRIALARIKGRGNTSGRNAGLGATVFLLYKKGSLSARRFGQQTKDLLCLTEKSPAVFLNKARERVSNMNVVSMPPVW